MESQDANNTINLIPTGKALYSILIIDRFTNYIDNLKPFVNKKFSSEKKTHKNMVS